MRIARWGLLAGLVGCSAACGEAPASPSRVPGALSSAADKATDCAVVSLNGGNRTHLAEADDGSGHVEITPYRVTVRPAGCTWRARSDSGWLLFRGSRRERALSGGHLPSYATCNTGAEREGAITLDGAPERNRTLTVRQAGGGGCGGAPEPPEPPDSCVGARRTEWSRGDRYCGELHSRSWTHFTGDAHHGGPSAERGFPVFDDPHAVCGYNDVTGWGWCRHAGFGVRLDDGGRPVAEWVRVPVTQ